jgi:hypothetical protein
MSMKYGVAVGGGALASATVEGNPSCSDRSVGSARRSLSLGGGVAASGGRCIGPGMGGAVRADDAPPPPTFAAFGPT